MKRVHCAWMAVAWAAWLGCGGDSSDGEPPDDDSSGGASSSGGSGGASSSGGSGGASSSGGSGGASSSGGVTEPAAPRKLLGVLTGLSQGQVTLREGGSGQTLGVTQSGPFEFAEALPIGSAYDVQVLDAPSGLACVVQRGQGTVEDEPGRGVVVSCGTAFHRVAGRVRGSSAELTLRNLDGPPLPVPAPGAFEFVERWPLEAPYEVAVARQPSGQRCYVHDGAGVIAGDVEEVDVECMNGVTVGGTVSGLGGGTVTLQLDGELGDGLVFAGAGTFTFPLRVGLGQPYVVTVRKQPAGHVCTVQNGQGVANAPVSNVQLACRPLRVAIDEVYPRASGQGPYHDFNGDGSRGTLATDTFVELVNLEPFEVSIGGWLLRTQASNAVQPATRFVFPQDASLAPGARAVVFGGGPSGGSFGEAQVFYHTGSLSLVVPTATTAYDAFTVQLAAHNGVPLDEYTYDLGASPLIANGCGTGCSAYPSMTRQPSGTGAFAPHHSVVGSQGVLASPGVAPEQAVPKLVRDGSWPTPWAARAAVDAPLLVHFNQWIDGASAGAANVELFASPCANPQNRVTAFSSFGLGALPTSTAARLNLVPQAPLAFDTVHCVRVSNAVRNVLGVPLPQAESFEFRTSTSGHQPAAGVVLSEIGGCRFAATAANTNCGGVTASSPGDDEFVELYNPTNAAIDISGLYIQRRSYNATSASCFAILPAGASIPARGHYLVGGRGYTASRYGDVAADYIENGTLPSSATTLLGGVISGGNETVLLLDRTAAACNTSANVADALLDAVSFAIPAAAAEPVDFNDILQGLPLPPLVARAFAPGRAIERKACRTSVAGAVANGMEGVGSHAARGNAQRLGVSAADWVMRTHPDPQNRASAKETPSCP